MSKADILADAKSDVLPQLQKLVADGQKLIRELQAENAKLKADSTLAIKKLEIEQFQADTERLLALGEAGGTAAAKPNEVMPVPQMPPG